MHHLCDFITALSYIPPAGKELPRSLRLFCFISPAPLIKTHTLSRQDRASAGVWQVLFCWRLELSAPSAPRRYPRGACALTISSFLFISGKISHSQQVSAASAASQDFEKALSNTSKVARCRVPFMRPLCSYGFDSVLLWAPALFLMEPSERELTAYRFFGSEGIYVLSSIRITTSSSRFPTVRFCFRGNALLPLSCEVQNMYFESLDLTNKRGFSFI